MSGKTVKKTKTTKKAAKKPEQMQREALLGAGIALMFLSGLSLIEGSFLNNFQAWLGFKLSGGIVSQKPLFIINIILLSAALIASIAAVYNRGMADISRRRAFILGAAVVLLLIAQLGVIYSKKAAAKKDPFDIKLVYEFDHDPGYKGLPNEEAKGCTVSGLISDAKLLNISGLAVKKDGSAVFAALSPDNMIVSYVRDKEGAYKKGIEISAGGEGIFAPYEGCNPGRRLHICAEEGIGALFVLDSCLGEVKEFGMDGSFRKLIAASPFLAGAGGISAEEAGLRLAAANPLLNYYVVFDIDGNNVKGHRTTRGFKLGELDGPASTAIDSKGRVYAGELVNGRVQIFDGRRYERYFRIGPVKEPDMPSLVLNESVNNPYIAVLNPDRRQIFLFLLNGEGYRTISLHGKEGMESAVFMAADGEGNLYIADRKKGKIHKITVPRDIMDTPPVFRRGPA